MRARVGALPAGSPSHAGEQIGSQLEGVGADRRLAQAEAVDEVDERVHRLEDLPRRQAGPVERAVERLHRDHHDVRHRRRVRQHLQREVRMRPERVAIGPRGVLQLLVPRHRVARIGVLESGEHQLRQAGQDGGLVRQVVVERHRVDPERRGEPAHGQRVDALVVDDPQRRRQDRLPAQPLLAGPGPPGPLASINHTSYGT